MNQQAFSSMGNSLPPDQNPNSRENTLVAFTDRNLVVFLILNNVLWVSRFKMSMHKTVFYFERSSAASIVERWQSGQPALYDIREVFKAESIFNAAVHDEI